MPFKKHQHVQYEVRGRIVTAIVKRAHKDGSATVEARFFLRPNGEIIPGYIGHKYRMPQHDLAISVNAS